MSHFFDSIIHLLISSISQIGYLGIFIGMFIESTLIPIPSELILIPAGIAASQNIMDIYVIIIVGVLGNLSGAVFSYYLAASIGRRILFHIGKYFFIKPTTIIKVEEFFNNHGPISVFIGRLIPGIRHFISLPAGVAKMNIKSFCFYTMAGSAIWATILSFLGFLIGQNQGLIKKHLSEIAVGCTLTCALIVITYISYKNKKTKTNHGN
jgi:membrane protein DedA with SNARE-associated domain